eukprot:4480198-Amphidinium_carterae.1
MDSQRRPSSSKCSLMIWSGQGARLSVSARFVVRGCKVLAVARGLLDQASSPRSLEEAAGVLTR